MEDLILKPAYSMQGIYSGRRNYTRTVYECISYDTDETCPDHYVIIDKTPCYVTHIAENVWEIQDYYPTATFKITRS